MAEPQAGHQAGHYHLHGMTVRRHGHWADTPRRRQSLPAHHGLEPALGRARGQVQEQVLELAQAQAQAQVLVRVRATVPTTMLVLALVQAQQAAGSPR